jgi:hypothetical protein
MNDHSAVVRRWATREDWERHKSTIAELYESMTLAQLKEHMELHHGLSATYVSSYLS